jgi:hypothetical protein
MKVKKILPQYLKAIVEGYKTFEIRKDAGWEVGDVVRLKEWVPKDHPENRDGEKDYYTLDYIDVVITYETDFAQMPGYKVYGIKIHS